MGYGIPAGAVCARRPPATAGTVRAMRTIDTAERRARLLARHRLTPDTRAGDVVAASRSLVGLHATDPASVYLSALARTRDLTVPAMERALYDDRSLLKILGMRRTMFVVPVDTAGVIDAACTQAIGVRERRRLLGMLEAAGIAEDPDAWLADIEGQTVGVLERKGEATATELTKEVPGLREQIPFGAGTKWAGTVGVSTRLLFLLALEGRVIRARPLGSWTSSLYRWAPVTRWVDGGLRPWPVDGARAELARRWLAAFGPGTVADLRWWSGWTLGETRRALAGVRTAEVELDGGRTGIVLEDDLDPAEPAGRPSVALLPALDATVMGWTERDWYLGAHRPALFDRNGNAGPTVWWEGRVIGGWAQRRTGEVVVRLLEDVGMEALAATERAAAEIGAWLGPTRVIPRFRTPLEQELSA